MHCQSELEQDLRYSDFLPDETMLKWYRDFYSTSKHLLTLYAMANGVNPKEVLEIGFGRSSFVLAKVAGENNGRFTTCDMRDFSYLLSEKEKEITNFICGLSDQVWKDTPDESLDFAFLDYFSGEEITEDFVKTEINSCLKKMKGNSIIAIHDVFDERYVVGDVLEKMSKSFKYKNRFIFSKLNYNYGLGILFVKPNKKEVILSDQQKKKAENG